MRRTDAVLAGDVAHNGLRLRQLDGAVDEVGQVGEGQVQRGLDLQPRLAAEFRAITLLVKLILEGHLKHALQWTRERNGDATS